MLTGDGVEKHEILKIRHFSFLPTLRHGGFLEQLARRVQWCCPENEVRINNHPIQKQTNDWMSVPCLWYPIICADSNRWKSSHHSPHGLLISKLEHHRRCQTSEGKKNSRFTIGVHWVVIFLNCVKNLRFFCSTKKAWERKEKSLPRNKIAYTVGNPRERVNLLHNNTGEFGQTRQQR